MMGGFLGLDLAGLLS